jgi:hypothetical protein
VSRIFEGSSEIMHLMIAREAVSQHLKVAGDLLTPGGDFKTKADAALHAGMFYSSWLPQLAVGKGQNPRSYDEFDELATYLRYVERSSRKLARSTFHGVRRWRAKLEQKQSFLGRIVDIGAELFAISSAVCYADTIGREQPERKTEAVELAELFCEQARQRAETLFNELWSNRDDANYAAAQRVLAGRYTWLEEGIADPSGDGPMMPPLVEQAAVGDEVAVSPDATAAVLERSSS